MKATTARIQYTKEYIAVEKLAFNNHYPKQNPRRSEKFNDIGCYILTPRIGNAAIDFDSELYNEMRGLLRISFFLFEVAAPYLGVLVWLCDLA